MRLLFLDIYRNSNSRISKDTAGGYGTENSLGDNLFGKTISWIVKRSIFWPNLSFIQLLQEFVSRGHFCHYEKKIGTNFEVEGSWDFIFICSSIVCFETEIEASKKILKKHKEKIFLCGSFARFVIDKIPKDIVVLCGNYEFLPQQMDNLNSSLNEVRKNRIVDIKNGKSENLEIINWHKINIKGLKNKLLGNTKYFFPFISTRGCPYSCREYCTYPTSQGTKIIQEPVDIILKKLKTISNKYPYSHLVFRDPVFSINIKHTKELLRLISNENLNIEFSAEVHLKNIDEELINLCKEANFKGLKFGIESAHKDVRDSVKRFSVENDEQMEKVDLLNRAAIKTVGMFILAQPHDTVETCLSTIDYACQLNLSIGQFSIFTPYPGTPFYDKKLYHNTFKKFEECNQYNLTYKHPNITKKEARDLLEKAYKMFLNSKIKNYFFKN